MMPVVVTIKAFRKVLVAPVKVEILVRVLDFSVAGLKLDSDFIPRPC